jgi:uncharacterized protein (TIGR01244 family)
MLWKGKISSPEQTGEIPHMFKLKLFAISLVTAACVLLALIYVNRPKQDASLKLNQVANGLFVTSQLQSENVSVLKRRGIRNIVDLRPDGEASDQATSTEIKQTAEANGMTFHYIPVPHGDIPKRAVDELKLALADQKVDTVLYCRTGNRAVRTLALMQASQANGPSAHAIVQMVHDAGFTADDLTENINQRIAQRSSVEEAKR